MELFNVEFYTTPEGAIMIKPEGEPVRELTMRNRDIISSMLSHIRERYPDAFKALSEIYSKSSRNRIYYEYQMVSRFIRCNFGEYDQYHNDVNLDGSFYFEEVHCPMRGECPFEEIICKPKLNSQVSDREMEVLALIAEGMRSQQIADELHISVLTVKRHKANMRAKLGLKTTGELAKYYLINFKR